MLLHFLFLALLLSASPAFAASPPCGLIDVEIRGTSLTPLYKDGDHVDAVTLQCLGREIVQNDIVIFKSGASQLPLIKRVIAVPGDRFTFGGNNLIVNGTPVINSENNPFYLSDNAGKLIHLYETQFKNVLPADIYLVMGDHDGVLDSSRLGPVAKQDILYVGVKSQ